MENVLTSAAKSAHTAKSRPARNLIEQLYNRPHVACLLAAFLLFFARCFAYQAPAAPAVNHLEDPFALGWMLVDTNGDGIADSINGKVVVPSSPSAFDNAAAANMAARLAYGSTGLTPPLVVTGDRRRDLH